MQENDGVTSFKKVSVQTSLNIEDMIILCTYSAAAAPRLPPLYK